MKKRKGLALILLGAAIIVIAASSIYTKQQKQDGGEGKIISGSFDESKFKSDAE